MTLPRPLLVLVFLVAALPVRAERIDVAAGGAALVQAIATAVEGDELILAPGLHQGPVTLDKALSLIGESGARVDGGGDGSVITVDAPGVVVRGLIVTGSGRSHETLASVTPSTLRLARAGHGMELTFANQMLNGFSQEDADKDAVEPTLLIDGIAEGHFQYRGLDEDGELDDWTDKWDEPSRLPVMVRIAFKMTPESGMTWPTMDIPLMMDVGSLPRRARSRPVPGQLQQDATQQRQPSTPPRPEDLQ